MSDLKQLADELHARDRQWKAQRDEFIANIERLEEEVEQKILAVDLNESPPTQYSKVETIDRNQKSAKEESPTNVPLGSPVDVGLVLKLQQKLKDLEKENGRLIRMVEDLKRERQEVDCTARTHNSFKMQELELENSQMKRDLGSLRKSVVEADSTAAPKTLIEQFEALQTELERRREECIQLHTVLADHTRRMKANYGPDVVFVNEDGELVLAFEAQKNINRQLEYELQANECRWKAQRDEWMAEIERLQEEVQRQQKILAVHLSKSPQTQTEADMQHEITRLTSENLELQEKYGRVGEKCRKVKKQMKMLQKRLGEAGLPENADMSGTVDSSTTQSSSSEATLMHPAIRIKKERDFEGMFEFRKEDINVIMRNLITELKPRVAVTLLPGLPAYILFMCIRHTDCINDVDKMHDFLTNFLNAIKRVIRSRDDFDCAVLWLSNTLRLLQNMKQYSGDKSFQLENTPRQNEQCLRNFDLSEYRVVLNNASLLILNIIITQLRERMQPFVVPALLGHEDIAGLNARAGSIAGQDTSANTSTAASQERLNLLLMIVRKTLQYHGVDPEIIVQIFEQLFYFMCASALNNLLLRNELCHWSKGLQIRMHVSRLERWARDVQIVPATDSLQPLVQAAQLLQARKNDEDVESVCEVCNKLTGNQIVKILNLYTPADEFETRVPVSFIRKVQEKLKERGEKNEELLMDLEHTFPVRVPFNPSSIRLEDIEIPEILDLPMLKKV